VENLNLRHARDWKPLQHHDTTSPRPFHRSFRRAKPAKKLKNARRHERTLDSSIVPWVATGGRRFSRAATASAESWAAQESEIFLSHEKRADRMPWFETPIAVPVGAAFC